MSIGFVVGIPGMPDVGGALGPTPPDNARVTTSGAYRVTTDGAFRVWTAGAVLPDVDSATRLLDIRASATAIASLTNGDPVATVANAGTAGGSFTQSGSARPTKRTDGGGHPYLEFDGVDDWMLGSAAINAALDNLTGGFAIFAVFQQPSAPSSNYSPVVISKMHDAPTGAGWDADFGYADFLVQAEGGSDYLERSYADADLVFDMHVWTGEVLPGYTINLYVDGDSSQQQDIGSGTPVTDISTTEPVRLGATALTIENGHFGPMHAYAIRIYAPAPNAGDRAAIEADMAADTGVTL